MHDLLIDTYGTLEMLTAITIFCGIIGASATSINGDHSGEAWQVHFKHMLDGFVMAAAISIPTAIFMVARDWEEALIFVGLFVMSILAPNVFRLIKTKGLDVLLSKIGGAK